MARFYERYGLAIVWVFTTVAGLIILYAAGVTAANQGFIAEPFGSAMREVHQFIEAKLRALLDFVGSNIQWFGAIGTLGTFVVGLVTGIRQAKRQLPRRLVEFMQAELTPVYDNTEALVGAIARRSADAASKQPLYRRNQLYRALDALGGVWRPRRKPSLDEAISEAETYIDTTEKRLQYLQDIRSHAQLLRGAVRSYDSLARRSDDSNQMKSDNHVESDFTEPITNESTKMAALELRGLLRARRLGNLDGALHDFVDLQEEAGKRGDKRTEARALRLQAEILVRQGAGENARLLIDARRYLNTADKLFDDGRTLNDYDRLERGQNREAYGTVQAALAALSGTTNGRAMRAFSDALKYYQSSNLTSNADLNRMRERMGVAVAALPAVGLVGRLRHLLQNLMRQPQAQS